MFIFLPFKLQFSPFKSRIWVELNHFWPMFPFYTSLKTSENLWFSNVARGYKMRSLARNGLTQPFKWQPQKMVKYIQTIRRQQPTNCLNVTIFWGLALKWLNLLIKLELLRKLFGENSPITYGAVLFLVTFQRTASKPKWAKYQ